MLAVGRVSNHPPTVERYCERDRALGARIYTLDLPGELTAHASGSADLARLCALAAGGRLDAQVGLECSWRRPAAAIDALLGRRIGGKAVLHID